MCAMCRGDLNRDGVCSCVFMTLSKKVKAIFLKIKLYECDPFLIAVFRFHKIVEMMKTQLMAAGHDLCIYFFIIAAYWLKTHFSINIICSLFRFRRKESLSCIFL